LRALGPMLAAIGRGRAPASARGWRRGEAGGAGRQVRPKLQMREALPGWAGSLVIGSRSAAVRLRHSGARLGRLAAAAVGRVPLAVVCYGSTPLGCCDDMVTPAPFHGPTHC
jgi:hypothetical protein